MAWSARATASRPTRWRRLRGRRGRVRAGGHRGPAAPIRMRPRTSSTQSPRGPMRQQTPPLVRHRCVTTLRSSSSQNARQRCDRRKTWSRESRSNRRPTAYEAQKRASQRTSVDRSGWSQRYDESSWTAPDDSPRGQNAGTFAGHPRRSARSLTRSLGWPIRGRSQVRLCARPRRSMGPSLGIVMARRREPRLVRCIVPS
jgi:hypothetical protein